MVPIVPWAALLIARCPIVATFHVHREHGHRWYPFARPILAPLMGRISRRIAVSESARRTVARHFPGTYDVVPNGIDVGAFAAPKPRPRECEPGALTVLYVGRLEPRKGVDVLIQAMPIVRAQVGNARLVIVGDGPDRDALASLARTVNAGATFAGRVEDAALPGYMQAADILCSPALGGESFGIVLLEAMACATPVVASRIEGYVELLGCSDCAVLVPPRDHDALARALSALLADNERRRTLAERGVAKVREYDWSAVAARLEGIYESARA
jgi:phosphatidylinositol alpha-mannosyltransferase